MSLRGLVAAAFGAVALATALPVSAAWLETRVKSHISVVDVDARGNAVVSEELVLAVRGGPLKTFDIAGADADADLLPDPSVVPIVKYGVPAPIPLAIARQDDGTLRVEVEREKGLFTGSYTFRFAYRTALLGRDRIRRHGAAAEVEWIGPRFSDGIDVAKVIFRLPEGRVTPTLAQGGDSDEAALGSAFLSAVRHTGGKVELEIVRPHVARGEPPLWRVAADPKIFEGLPAKIVDVPAERAARIVPVELPAERAGFALAAIALAVIYALIVFVKSRLVAADAQSSSAAMRSLVPLPAPLRAALAGASLGAAALLGALGDYPNVAACTLLAAVALAWLRAPIVSPKPRGPGHWFVLTEEEAFAKRRVLRRARWFDAGTLPGFALLSVLSIAFGVGARLLVLHSPYHALSLLLGAFSLLPIFGTGRSASLPVERVSAAQRTLARIKRRLSLAGKAKVVPWARIPDGGDQPDELRLLVRPRAARDGLTSVEVGVEFPASPSGFFPEAFVLVRVREGSPADNALAGSTTFQRGRRADERVAVFRPGLPSADACARVVESVVESVQAPQVDGARGRATSRLSSRFGVASPAQAADAA